MSATCHKLVMHDEFGHHGLLGSHFCIGNFQKMQIYFIFIFINL